MNTPGSFRCDCPRGITGERCEININECESSPCENEGTCLDDIGEFRCVCIIGKSLSLSILFYSNVVLILFLFGLFVVAGIRGVLVLDNALYKSTFYLLTCLLLSLKFVHRVSKNAPYLMISIFKGH